MNSPAQPTRRDWLRRAAAGGLALAATRRATAAEPAGQAIGVPEAKPEDIGLDPRRLQVAYDLLEKWTGGPNPPVPSAAIVVGRAGRRIAVRRFGKQGPEPGAKLIRPDAMFYLASVTKPVVFTAAMLLVERGQLNLNDKVTRYLPEFAANGKGDTQVLHLFTHTSGLPDELPDNAELRRQQAPLKKFIEESIAAKPLFKAGTQFSYSSSGTMAVAEIVQRLAGVSIHEFIRREILEPLGLKSTGLGAKGLDPERIVRCTLPDYQVGSPGNWNSAYWQQFGSPAGGMYSTPEDYAVICALMLNGGKWGNVRLLSPAAVRAMTSNHLHDLPDLPEPVRRTQPWGLGWRLNHPGRPESWSDLLDRHVFGHTGSAGNVVWMDPRTQGFCILLTNYLYARAPWRLVHLSNAVAAAFI